MLAGDPSKSGPFVLRIRGPEGYLVPPHWHSTDEDVTVLSGSFGLGMDDEGNPKSGMVLAPGGFAHLPARMHHFAWAVDGPFVIEIHTIGPFDIHYIHPEDEPRQ